MEGTYLLAMRCPVYRRRDSHPGFRTELENLVGNDKGEAQAEVPEADSTDVPNRGGLLRRSDEPLFANTDFVLLGFIARSQDLRHRGYCLGKPLDRNCTVTLSPMGSDCASCVKLITASRTSRSILSDGSPV